MSEQDEFKRILNNIVLVGEKEKTLSAEELIKMIIRNIEANSIIKEVPVP